MAKLEIFNSKLKVAGGATPRPSTLVLPMSLASNVRSGVQAITKSIADIQKDLYKADIWINSTLQNPRNIVPISNIPSFNFNDTDKTEFRLLFIT